MTQFLGASITFRCQALQGGGIKELWEGSFWQKKEGGKGGRQRTAVKRQSMGCKAAVRRQPSATRGRDRGREGSSSRETAFARPGCVTCAVLTSAVKTSCSGPKGWSSEGTKAATAPADEEDSDN